MDKYNSTKEILYSTGDYVIHVCCVRDPMLECETLAYGIYNTQTTVREAEARRLKNAITICDYIANPSPKIEELAMQGELPIGSVN